MIVALLFTVLGALGGFMLAWVLVRGKGDESPRTRRTSGLMNRQRSQESLLAAFRPDEVPEPDDVRREDQRILVDALREIATRRGAAAAVLWVLDETGGGVAVCVASSSSNVDASQTAAVVPAGSEADRALIEWAARERMLAFNSPEESLRLAVAPLEAGELKGALSLHFEEYPTVAREVVREWLPKHAAMLQTWYALVRTRAEATRQNFRLRGLIRTAGTLQATRDPLELESTLVGDSLTVVGADWAVLIRWDEGARTGSVRAATPGAIELGLEGDALEVSAESVAGQVCSGGRPQVFADARAFSRGEDLIFGGRVRLGPVGSLLAVPLRRSEQDKPIGALVCGHHEVAALRAMEARNAGNLGIIAAGALETAWQVEDALRNARLDALTQLSNRRGFDERFSQIVMETDRYGGTAALILVDLDYFKRVNDTYGHETGDAVLVAVANTMAEGRRTVDLAARLGGEELALLLPQTDAAGARELADRLRRRIEELRVRTAMGEVRVTASFGIGEYVARAGDAEKVMVRADQALYAAKRNGRNRVEVAT